MQINRVSPQSAPRMRRFSTDLGLPRGARVDREAGVIYGYSVITRGEAKGHKVWIDHAFLEEVSNAGNKAEKGIKSRFTHPGMSGDGLANNVGRTKNFRAEGDQVFGDLHFIENPTSQKIQDNINTIFDLSEQTPELFGASIVFSDDDARAKEHFEANTKDGKFISPDPANALHLPHARLGYLAASDFVDRPAANPSGMFCEGGELAALGESMLEYVFGLTDELPETQDGLPHPERMRLFVSDFLDRRGLLLSERPALTPNVRKFVSAALQLRQRQVMAEMALKGAGR